MWSYCIYVYLLFWFLGVNKLHVHVHVLTRTHECQSHTCVCYMYMYICVNELFAYTCTCFIHMHRLKLEAHKQSLAVMEPENRKFKQECKHLQKVKVMHKYWVNVHIPIVQLCISMYTWLQYAFHICIVGSGRGRAALQTGTAGHARETSYQVSRCHCKTPQPIQKPGQEGPCTGDSTH